MTNKDKTTKNIEESLIVFAVFLKRDPSQEENIACSDICLELCVWLE